MFDFLAELEAEMSETQMTKKQAGQILLENALMTGAGLPDSPEEQSGSPRANIGHRSLDWRLATPQMERSLSTHLCDGETTSFLSSFSFEIS